MTTRFENTNQEVWFHLLRAPQLWRNFPRKTCQDFWRIHYGHKLLSLQPEIWSSSGWNPQEEELIWQVRFLQSNLIKVICMSDLIYRLRYERIKKWFVPFWATSYSAVRLRFQTYICWYQRAETRFEVFMQKSSVLFKQLSFYLKFH